MRRSSVERRPGNQVRITSPVETSPHAALRMMRTSPERIPGRMDPSVATKLHVSRSRRSSRSSEAISRACGADVDLPGHTFRRAFRTLSTGVCIVVVTSTHGRVVAREVAQERAQDLGVAVSIRRRKGRAGGGIRFRQPPHRDGLAEGQDTSVEQSVEVELRLGPARVRIDPERVRGSLGDRSGPKGNRVCQENGRTEPRCAGRSRISRTS